MPTEVNGILVCTLEELVPQFWPSYDALKKALKRAEKQGFGVRRVDISMPGVGKGRRVLVDFDSLSNQQRDVLGDPRLGKHILEYYYKVDAEAVQYFQNNGYIDDSRYQRNVINASVLGACVRLLADREQEIISKGCKPKKMMQTLCADTTSFNNVLIEKFDSCHTLPSTHRPFGIKLNKYIDNGYGSLINGLTGKDSNRKKIKGDVVAMLQGRYAPGGIKPTYQRVKREWDAFKSGAGRVINPETGEQYNPDDFPSLSRSAIYNWLSSYESAIGSDARRDGDRKALTEKYMPYAGLEKPEFAGMIISVDDRQPPFECLNDKRIWAYVGQDVASQAVTVIVFGETKEEMIENFYRQMLKNYAQWGFCLPYELECESSLNSTLQKGILKPGNMFTEIRVERNNARGKYIEQGYNKGIRYQDGFEKDQKGWIARPFAKDKANTKPKGKVPKLPYEEIVKMEIRLSEDWNNMEHPGHKGKSRWEVFEELQHPELNPINWRGILPYLGVPIETSCNAGAIDVNGESWYVGENGSLCFDDDLTDRLNKLDGKVLTAYWLRGNDGNMLKILIYIGDCYICEAVPKPMPPRAKLGMNSEREKAKELWNKYYMSVLIYQKRQAKKIEPMLFVQDKPMTLNSNFSFSGTQRDLVPDYAPPEEMPAINDDVISEELVSVPMPSAKPSMRDRF